MSTDNSNSDKIKKELLNIAPTLASIKKKAPEYEVPSGYFSELPDLVLAKCTVPVERNLSDKWYPRYYATAASIALLALCLWVFNTRVTHDVNFNLENINSEEIAYFIDNEDYTDISEELLVDYVVETESNELDIEAQEIIDYLIEDDIELNTIINEYY